MTTINLYQNKEKEAQSASQITANMGFVFSLSILIITVVALAGIKVASFVMEKKNMELSDSLSSETANLAGLADLQRVVSLQKKLTLIKENLKISNNEVTRLKTTDVLGGLEKDMAPGVLVRIFDFDTNSKLKVTFTATNFSDIAKQISNFKKSDNFSGAEVTNISRSDKDIECEVTMALKK